MGGHVEMIDCLLAAGADLQERRGISHDFRGDTLRAIASKRRDSATDNGARERYATIVQRLQ